MLVSSLFFVLLILLYCMLVSSFQNFHPFFLGNDYIGPAVDHFQEITARFPQVISDIVTSFLLCNSFMVVVSIYYCGRGTQVGPCYSLPVLVQESEGN